MASSQVAAAAAGPTRPFMIFWRILLFVALLQAGLRQSDARAVNVSNTWTMPQEGLNVFYRFFRDRISWFEADAVCQFHHANLVTVDNSFQFDATRDLLRELDVNDIVWIGLMRPLSSEHFMWSNSRPLIADTGYWAESLPLMESPLCAVIDPIRDYRWHALRCGGPETASFLCEMPVPSWADACILRDMPNLTMQYMADTASVELIRNCAEEGQLRQTCKGKQDRERVIRELICPRERLEAQRINDITNSHFKSLQIINSIPSDNNENNDIELMPMEPRYPPSRSEAAAAAAFYSREDVIAPTEKNTVQRLIEQFSVDELMQADDPSQVMYGIPGEIPKPVKKGAGKKAMQPNRSGVATTGISDYPKKVNKPVNGKQEYPDYRMEDSQPKPVEQQQQHRFSLEDMMMGDQPQGEPEMLDLGAGEKPVNGGPDDDEVSNEIMAPLPHKKKVLQQDLKTMATITEAPATVEKPTEEPKKAFTEEQKKLQAEKDEEEKMREAKEDKQKKEMEAKTTEAVTPKALASESPEKKDNSKEDSKESSAESKESKEEAEKPSVSEPTSPQSTVASQPTVTSTAPSMTSDTPHNKEPVATSPSSQSLPSSSPEVLNTEQLLTTDSTTVPATIGHPMHPQQPRSNVITEETQHPHIKESADNSHFIPPMLLVKSHYVPPGKPHDGAHHDLPHHIESGELMPHHTGHSEADLKTTTHDKLLDATAPKGQVLDKPETTILKPVMKQNSSEAGEKVEASATTEKAGPSEELGIASTTATTTPKEEVATTLAAETSAQGATTPKETTKTETPTITQLAETSTSSPLGTTEKPVATTKVATVEESTTAGSPLADSKAVITLSSTEKSVSEATGTSTEIRKIETVPTDKPGHEHDKLPSTSGPTVTITTTIAPSTDVTAKKHGGVEHEAGSSSADDKVSSTPAATTTTKPAITPTTAMNAPTTVITGGPTSRPTHAEATTPTTANPPKLPSTPKIDDESLTSTESGDGSPDGADDSSIMSTTHNFLKDEPEMPFKPNRHRSLTKPESVSYFKKILG